MTTTVCEVEGCSSLAKWTLPVFGPEEDVMKKMKTEGKDIPEYIVTETSFGEKWTVIVFRVCEHHKNEAVWSTMNYNKHCDLKFRRGEWVSHMYKEGVK
jgi:hypothetical protein